MMSLQEPSLFSDKPTKPLPRLCVGTSGYSFRDWVGPFYPPAVPARQHLQYYAGRFPCLEVNVTHYAVPEPAQLERMAECTPTHFAFIVKLHQTMTHTRDADAPYARFTAALEPLRQAGKLHGVLAQFPFGFHHTARNRDHLLRLRDQFPHDDFFAEYRHASWLQDTWLEHMRRSRIGYVCVDEPPLRDLVPPVVHATTDIGYVRLHGRNAATWYARDPSQGDRYDYLYSDQELREWAARIRALIQETRRIFVLFNNCHAGKAPANAQAMKDLLEALGE